MARKRKTRCARENDNPKRLKAEELSVANKGTIIPRSSLLSLPVELRMRIYAHLFPDKEVPAFMQCCLKVEDFRNMLRKDGEPCYTAVTATCRQINREACDLLYGSAPIGRVSLVRPRYLDKRAQLPPECPGRRSPELQCFNVESHPLFNYIRTVKVTVIAYPTDNDTRLVRSRPLRKNHFDGCFAVYDAPHAIVQVIRRLEAAPLLRELHISIRYALDEKMPFHDRDLEAYRPTVEHAKVLLNTFDIGRNFKKVVIESVMPSKGYRLRRLLLIQSLDLGHEKQEMEQLKRKIQERMQSNQPTGPLPVKFEQTSNLKDFVWKLREHGCFYEMCRKLYRAVHLESLDDREGFEDIQDQIHEMWQRQEELLTEELRKLDSGWLGTSIKLMEKIHSGNAACTKSQGRPRVFKIDEYMAAPARRLRSSNRPEN